MNFATAFLRTLPWRPHDALAALYWHVTGRRVRARNRLRLAAEQAPHAYGSWMRTVERPARAAAIAAMPALAALPERPLFSVVLHTAGGDVARTVASLETQVWKDWELVIVAGRSAAPVATCRAPRMVMAPERTDDGARALAAGIAAARGSHIVPVAAGAQLAPTALLHLAEAVRDNPEAVVFYGDHDQIDTRGHRSRPWFKPLWNAEMFLAQDYISAACAIAIEPARAALPLDPAAAEAATYALLLAVAAQANALDGDSGDSDPDGVRIVHVPHVLAHLRAVFGVPDRPARMAAIERRLAGSGVALRDGPGDTIVVTWPLPADPPLVSVIVPTRDNLVLLRACVHSVLTNTRYRPFEVLIVDNGSVDPEVLGYLDRVARNPAVRVVRYVAPFNYSAINNFAVRAARGQYLCLLNDDTEVLDPQWLGEMMRHAVRPHVGAVGAKLLYDDGSIQHAGVTVGVGNAAGHAHRYQRDGDVGYFHRAEVAHYATAVTAACLVVSRDKFEALGGLDEETFAIAFNDVDFCLKLRRAGWHNIYQPRAVLLHHESKSRGKDIAPSQIARFHRELAALRERWQTMTFIDPLHHPQLDSEVESYIVRL